MKKLILITGVGITGKSSLRRLLKKFFPQVIDIDGDYERVPRQFVNNQVYVIEDVHALTDEACLPLDNYNLIIYLLPSFYFHVIFWLKRAWRWFQIGSGSWDKKRQGWLGNGKRHDPVNIPLFLYLMIRDLWKRNGWINQDMKALSQFKNPIIIDHPEWKKEIKFHLMPNLSHLINLIN